MFVKTIILAGLTYIILKFLKWLKNTYQSYVAIRKIPGPSAKGFLPGNFYHFQTTPEKIFNLLRLYAKKFYPIYQLHAVHRGGANFLCPEDCELVLSNPIHNEKGLYYKLVHGWLKFGLLTSYGTKWQTRRKILTPAFHFNVLQEFIVTFNEEAQSLVESLKKECFKSYIDVTPIINQFTLKTIAETAMGTKLDFESEKGRNYKKNIYDICRILMYRLIHPLCILDLGNIFLNPRYFKELKLTKELHNFTREVIEERKKTFNIAEIPHDEHSVYKGKKRLAMLDLLLLANIQQGIIDDDGIQEEVDTFTFEGHDTTATALGFIFMLLSIHSEAQDLIIQEMQEILGDDLHKKPTYADYQNMKYLERCIKESLRLYPSVFFIGRTLGEDLKTSSGYILKKSSIVTIHIYDIHHDANIYPDPEKFDPDRFLPENIAQRHPYSYLPFSAGPRNCIGQKFAILELKAAVCAVLANFILEPIDTPETITLVVDIVLRTKEGIKIRFVPRQ